MEGNVMASTALQFHGELKKGKLIFRVRIWIDAIASTPDKWLNDFPNGFTYHWAVSYTHLTLPTKA